MSKKPVLRSSVSVLRKAKDVTNIDHLASITPHEYFGVILDDLDYDRVTVFKSVQFVKKLLVSRFFHAIIKLAGLVGSGAFEADRARTGLFAGAIRVTGPVRVAASVVGRAVISVTAG